MNTMQKVRESLQKYLRETPKEVLKKQFEHWNQMDSEEVTIREYVRLSKLHHTEWNNAPIVQLKTVQFRELIWNPMPAKVSVSILLLQNRSNPISKPHFNNINNLALAA